MTYKYSSTVLYITTVLYYICLESDKLRLIKHSQIRTTPQYNGKLKSKLELL